MPATSDSYVVDVLLAMHSPWHGESVPARRLRRLTASVFDSYRPELHFMRGPGPKWHERMQVRCARVAVQLDRRNQGDPDMAAAQAP